MFSIDEGTNLDTLLHENGWESLNAYPVAAPSPAGGVGQIREFVEVYEKDGTRLSITWSAPYLVSQITINRKPVPVHSLDDFMKVINEAR